MSEANMPCVACLNESLRPFGPREGYAYHLCPACGSLQLCPQPTAAELRTAYETDYAAAEHCHSAPAGPQQDEQTRFIPVLDALRAHGVTGRVLDCGAGWGGLMCRIQSLGLDCDGLEPSSDMAAHCKKEGLNIIASDIKELGEKSRYGAIVLTAVFEHLVDHTEWLTHAQRLLEPGGLLISAQPTALFPRVWGDVLRLGRKQSELPRLHQIICPPWHTVLFSIRGMRALVERNGFEFLDVCPVPQQRQGGVVGAAQVLVEGLNKVGWPIFGTHWPLIISHAFVFRKPA